MRNLTWQKLTGLTLLLVPTTTLLVNVLLQIIGVTISAYHFPFAICVILTLAWYIGQKGAVKYFWLAPLLTLLIIPIAIVVALLFYDYSFDGQAYHQWNIFNLTKGWNPVWEYCPGQECTTIWSDSYPKGVESVAASIYAFIGNIEAGKAVGYLFCASVFFFSLDFLSEYLKNTHIVLRVFYSLIAAFPAVVVCQLFTYYIDHVLYGLIIILLITCWSLYKERHVNLDLMIVATLCVLAISIKFTYAFWVVMMLLPLGGLLIFEKRWKLLWKGIGVAVSFLLFGMLIVSFNPYITNLLRGHHLLYPLMGKDAIDIITRFTPNICKNMPAVVCPSLSLISDMTWSDFKPIYSGYFAYGGYDCRMGGFGFLFSIMLLVSTIILVASRTRTKEYYVVVGLYIYLFICLHILPAGWWARYVSFYAIAPLLVLVYVTKHPLKWQGLTWILSFLFVVNIGTALFFSFAESYSNHKQIELLLNSVRRDTKIRMKHHKFAHSIEIKFMENGIQYIEDASADSVFHFRQWDVRIAKEDLK